MTAKTKTKKPRSRLLDEMHATARGLHAAGLISARRMHEYNALARRGDRGKRASEHR